MGRTSASRTRNRSRRAARGRPSRSGSRRRSLRRLILSRVLVISILPLLMIAMIALSGLVALLRTAEHDLEAGRDELVHDGVGRGVRTEAQGVAREVDHAIGERVDDIVVLSRSPVVRNAARAARQTGDALVILPTSELEQQYNRQRRLAAGSAAERRLRTIMRRQPQFSELFFTEGNGLTVAASARTDDFVQSDETWWNRAWDSGFVLDDVEVDATPGVSGLVVATRVEAANGEPLGVIRAVIRLDELHRITSRIAEDTGSDITILARDGRLLAETSSDHDPERIANPDVELEWERADVVAGALTADGPGYVLADSAVAGFAPLDINTGRLSELLDGFADAELQGVRWVAVVERSNDVALAPLSGLADVQRGLSWTARRFGLLMVLALLVAVLAAFVVSTRLAQRIVRPLRALGATARNIADNQLPMLVRHAQAPADRDGAALPVLPTVELETADEIEDVADAFNAVSSTAAELAADQAQNRRNVSRMFVTLGRRNQSLVNRQLEVIDTLEGGTSDPDLLEDLFRLDHLATRMRRNAESLLVLAGEEPARRWSEPVSLTSVVRGASAEIEDYRRVNFDGVDEVQVAGSVVGDLTHLVAELIENATQFSPPDTAVMVVGRRVVDGYALAVADGGVGMSQEQLRDANRRIDMAPQVDRVPSSFLGLFVVGRLAARHGIRVRLVESATEGVTAKILLPTALVVQEPPAQSPGALAEMSSRALPSDTPDGAPAEVGVDEAAAGVGVDVAPDGVGVDGAPAEVGGDVAPAEVSVDGAPAEVGADGSRDEVWLDVSVDVEREPVEVSAAAGHAPAVKRDASSELEGASRSESSGVDTTVDTMPFHRIEVDVDPDSRDATALDDITVDLPAGPDREDALDRDADAVDPEPAPGELDGAEAQDGGAADAVRANRVDTDAASPDTATTDAATTDTATVFEVRRRVSRRESVGVSANGRRPAALRTEPPATGRPSTTPPPHHTPPRETVRAETDDAGVTLRAAERKARAARDRLSRFQQAVKRGHTHSRSRNGGGDNGDA